ncbi:cAMP-dependent protein kinase subunit [Hanseniaspora guilliermondii]
MNSNINNQVDNSYLNINNKLPPSQLQPLSLEELLSNNKYKNFSSSESNCDTMTNNLNNEIESSTSVLTLIDNDISNKIHKPIPQSVRQPHLLLNESCSSTQIRDNEPSQQYQIVPRVTKGKYKHSDFQIMRTLGTGSFGRVHLVQSTHNYRYYAMKVLKKSKIIKLKQVEHTNDERLMLSAVNHPFIIRMWGTFQDLNFVYMIMDYIEGGELFSLLRKSKKFPVPVAKFYAAEVILAIEYLHKHDIIYRDLKPENILLDKYGHIKLTDFGFAKYCNDVTFTIVGTPDYIAAEIIQTKGYNKSVDWWSLGILIYEMLSGFTPFYDSNTLKTYDNILNAPLKFPMSKSFSNEVIDLLTKLINRDLSQRLGNLQNGVEDIKSHVWFQEVNWHKMYKKNIETPYEPPIKAGHGDTSQYEYFEEDTEDMKQYGIMLNYGEEDPYQDVFDGF